MGEYGRFHQRLLSQPYPVLWAGWETTTLALQRAGWSIAAEEMPYEGRLRIALHHQSMRLYGFSDELRLDHYRDIADINYRGLRRHPLVIQGMAPNVHIHNMTDTNFAEGDWKAIDATPQMVMREILSIEDFNIFAPCQHRTEEVFVDQADMGVVDHLSAILEQQADKQRELRAKAQRSERQSAQADSKLLMQIVKVA